jgi:hypothetical protein
MIFIPSVYAQCPACVVVVGGGLIIAKKLGIDDLLVSIWLSGLNTAIAFWIASTIKKEIWNNKILWSTSFYLLAIIYLWYSKQIGHPSNKFWGIDKVFLGITIGFFVFLLAILADQVIRQKNKGKKLFNYQRVIVPLSFLIIATLIFNILLI